MWPCAGRRLSIRRKHLAQSDRAKPKRRTLKDRTTIQSGLQDHGNNSPTQKIQFVLSVTGQKKASRWKDIRALQHATGTQSIRTKQSIHRGCSHRGGSAVFRKFVPFNPCPKGQVFFAPGCWPRNIREHKKNVMAGKPATVENHNSRSGQHRYSRSDSPRSSRLAGLSVFVISALLVSGFIPAVVEISA